MARTPRQRLPSVRHRSIWILASLKHWYWVERAPSVNASLGCWLVKGLMSALVPDRSKVQIAFLATFMLSDTFNECIRGYYDRASIPKINRLQLFATEVPLPPLATQEVIVAEIEAEQTLVSANRDLIARCSSHFLCSPD